MTEWKLVKETCEPCNLQGPQAKNKKEERDYGSSISPISPPLCSHPHTASIPGVEANFVSTPIHHHWLHTLLSVIMANDLQR